MEKYYDLSLPISARLPVWPGDPPVTVVRTSALEQGDAANVSRIDMGSHTGTHIDAPLHFEPGGAPVDALPLDVLIGPARLVELDAASLENISARDIDQIDLKGVCRLLFKTRNCRMWKDPHFRKDYVYIAEDAAARLVEKGVRLVGVDYLSVESFSNKTFSTHHRLLRAGVVILEGLDPSEAPPGDYDLIALPLRIVGCDGAPARVILKSRISAAGAPGADVSDIGRVC